MSFTVVAIPLSMAILFLCCLLVQQMVKMTTSSNSDKLQCTITASSDAAAAAAAVPRTKYALDDSRLRNADVSAWWDGSSHQGPPRNDEIQTELATDNLAGVALEHRGAGWTDAPWSSKRRLFVAALLIRSTLPASTVSAPIPRSPCVAGPTVDVVRNGSRAGLSQRNTLVPTCSIEEGSLSVD